jgi:hypothetical protein
VNHRRNLVVIQFIFNPMNKWNVVGVVFEGEPISIGGLNPWKFKWRHVEIEPIELPHPQHASELHRMGVYEIEGRAETVTFAAGELSPGVWDSIFRRPNEPRFKLYYYSQTNRIVGRQ